MYYSISPTGIANNYIDGSLFLFVYKANGLDERYNQTLQNMLVKAIEKKKEEWDQFLDPCVYAYNTAVHESTKFTPFQLMFGRKAVLPIDIDIDDDVDPQDSGQESDDMNEAIQVLTDRRMESLASAKENILEAQEKQRQVSCTMYTINYIVVYILAEDNDLT